MRSRVLGAIAVLLAAGGALFHIQRLNTALELERRRVYVLADALEVLQAVTRQGGVFEPGVLPASRLVYARDVTRPEALTDLPPGFKAFAYSLDLDEQTRREYDRKYRGDELLEYGPRIVVDKRGRVVSIDWSKP